MLPHARNGRASSFRSPSEGDIAKKRARGELTCAECKRLKLKCDKKIPCSSCIRRGCSKICPQGSFTLGQSSRTEQLHRQISAMNQRIRRLEDALASLQASVSSDPHPLLQDDLLSSNFGSETRQAEDVQSSEDFLSGTMDAFGTLTIGDGGESRYFGSSGGSETLLMAHADSATEPSEKQSEPPKMTYVLNRLASMFPMGDGCTTDPQEYEDVIDMMLDSLPPTSRACSLLEAYMGHASWSFQPATREHIVEDFLTPIYNAKSEREDTDDLAATARAQISPHKLAVLFVVLAIGANLDFTQHEEAEIYYHHARAALTHGSFLDSPLTETIVALLLMAQYRGTANKHPSRDSSWALIGLACKLAQSLGMHRDPGQWNMDEKTANKRRRLFWELCSIDMFISVTMGRPPSIELSYVDCAFPQDKTEPEAQYWNWKHQFVKEVFGPVIKATLAAEPPSYTTILELDRKAREKPLPPALTAGHPDDGLSAETYLQCALLSQFRTLTVSYLHKSFFAQALLDHPENPLLSRYAPSFLAASSCASDIIRESVINLEIMPRWWTMWTHLFSAAMVVCSIVTSAPSSSMASKAYLELGIAVDLLAKGVNRTPRARWAMEILIRLQEKASTLFKQPHGESHMHSLSSASKMTLSNKAGAAADELAIFGGQTRVLFTRMHVQGPPPNSGGTSDPSLTRPATGANPPPTSHKSVSASDLGSSFSLSSTSHSRSSVGQEDMSMSMQSVHPSLMEYTSTLGPPDPIKFSCSSASSGYPESSSSSHRHLGEQPIRSATGTAGPSQSHLAISSQSPIPDFLHQQPLAEHSTRMYQDQTQDDCTYDPTLFGPFEQFYRQATSASNSQVEAVGAHLDMVSNGPGGGGAVNDRWMHADQWCGVALPGHGTFNST